MSDAARSFAGLGFFSSGVRRRLPDGRPQAAFSLDMTIFT
jgi:hypothetical protein